MEVVQEWASEYQKWSYLIYPDRFEFGDLENPHRRRCTKLGDFNKIAEKLALTIVRAFLPVLDNFQIFAKMPYLIIKYSSEVTKPI